MRKDVPHAPTVEDKENAENPESPFYVAARVKRAMHQRGITVTVLAEALEVTRSGASKILHRPNAVLPYLQRISNFLSVPIDELNPIRRPVPRGTRVEAAPIPQQAHRTPAIEEGLGSALRDKTVHVIPAGWAIVRVAMDSGEAADMWLCGAAGSLPRDGNRVVVLLTNGSQINGKYYPGDAEGECFVVPEAQRPRVLKRDDIEEMRTMYAPIGTVR